MIKKSPDFSYGAGYADTGYFSAYAVPYHYRSSSNSTLRRPASPTPLSSF